MEPMRRSETVAAQGHVLLCFCFDIFARLKLLEFSS